MSSVDTEPAIACLMVTTVFFLPSSPSFYVSSDFKVTVIEDYVVVSSIVWKMVLETGASVLMGRPPIGTSGGLGTSPIYYTGGF